MAGPAVIRERADPAVQRIVDITRPSRSVVKSVLIEDAEPLGHCLRAGVEFIEVYGTEGVPVPADILGSCREQGIALRLIEPAVMEQIFRSDKRPRVFGVARVPRPARLGDLSAGAGDVVVLDGVKIVGNIGAIVRTAVAFGAAGIVLVDSDLPGIADRRLIRASRGYVFSLPIVLATREQVIGYLREGRFSVVGLDAGGDLQLGALGDLDRRLALVFGGERNGPSGDLQGLLAGTVGIAMDPLVESLNVSVAVGIALQQRASRNLHGAGSRRPA